MWKHMEARYQEGDGCEYHIYMNGTYYQGLNREDILEILQSYFQERENR